MPTLTSSSNIQYTEFNRYGDTVTQVKIYSVSLMFLLTITH